ncbi:MAG: DUF72 domain-containing protein [Beijerinckiaceae bacterium]|nr:DUF72 domain-containing protein [Beijerinckiaceae bacterium]
MIWRIGTAGWSIASQYADRFPETGFALERYAKRFSCVEINSSFYRSHRPATWTRWASIVPVDFRFAVKVPRTITHDRGLRDCGDLITRLIEETAGLGQKLGVLLVQLPPKLSYHAGTTEAFFSELAVATTARIACEPRHASWFEPDAEHLLAKLEVARVAADPARVAAAGLPGGWRGLAYWRLHGSPVMYRSPYGRGRIGTYAALIEREQRGIEAPWCIFDNTASAAAMGDAFELALQAPSA